MIRLCVCVLMFKYVRFYLKSWVWYSGLKIIVVGNFRIDTTIGK